MKIKEKVFSSEQIMKVTDDLESRGGKCMVNVTGVQTPDGSVGYILHSIDVQFPTHRWKIVDFEIEE